MDAAPEYGDLETAITAIMRTAWRRGEFPTRQAVAETLLHELGGRTAIAEALATFSEDCYLYTTAGYPVGRAGLQQLLQDSASAAC